MNKAYYELLTKRKSFHSFENTGDLKLTPEDLAGIEEAFSKCKKLIKVDVACKIVKASETTMENGNEYAILLYSEKEDNYLANIGYIGEQLDLYLNLHGIATLWCGMGKPEEKEYQGLDYVIMLGIKKVDPSILYRHDVSEFNRKPIDDIWQGLHPMEMVRYAPSACNSQPWIIKEKFGNLEVHRYNGSAEGDYSSRVYNYFNHIDIGIMMCFLEIVLEHEDIEFSRKVYDDCDRLSIEVLNAKYQLY